MKAYSIVLSGRWGHFRRPEANNNPITYDFIPKTAFIGLIAAVIGMRREELKNHYEQMCNSIFYNVEILKPISKVATNFRIYKYEGSLTSVGNPPQFYELLQEPKFRINFFGSDEYLDFFIKELRNGHAHFNPIFGLANCPANISEFKVLEMTKTVSKEVNSRGFIPFQCRPKISTDITLSYDSIPVVQNNDWFNTKYEKVFYGYVPDGKFINFGKSDYKHQYIHEEITYFYI